MEYIEQAMEWLFGANGELRQILLVTLEMSCMSTFFSTLIGMPLGVLLGSTRSRARKPVMRVVQTLMGLPPVVAGLLVFMLLSRSGPLGSFKLLYSLWAMVIAQVVLITPIIIGLTASFVSGRAPQILETTAGLGMPRRRAMWLIICECRAQLIAIMLTGFARSIAEVGAVQLVGGNVQYKTRVMTTAIVLETNKGNFEFAVVLGVLLLILALVVNIVAGSLQEDKGEKKRKRKRKKVGDAA